jgi:predicted dehydrogenase
MALDITPEQRTIGQANFHRTVGKLAEGTGAQQGVTRRRFMQGLVAAGAVLPVSAAAYFGYSSNNGGAFRPVKAGLIGAGDEGGVLVGDHNPRYVEFVAYSDIRPTNWKRIFDDEQRTNPRSPRRGFNHHYGERSRDKIRRYENYHDLLADQNIEMVVIALPLHLHAQATIDALRAGKHVLCEKLMARNIRDCKAMIREARQADRLLAVGHQRHYSMLYAHATEVVNSGVLGDVKHIRALWHRNNVTPVVENGREVIDSETGRPRLRDSWRPLIHADDRRVLNDAAKLRRYGYKSLNELIRWRLYHRTGGGLMAELGSHQLDACSIFLGKTRDHHVYPLAVTATGGKHSYQDDREIEDHVYCIYEFPGKNYNSNQPARDRNGRPIQNDVVTVTYSSINTNAFEPYGECVMGSKGTLVVESEQSVMLWGSGGRSTAVSVTTTGGRPALDASDSVSPGAQQAAATGAQALGQGPPSRGYKEEMEHLAWCIRMRNEGSSRDRSELRPRCDGQAAMDDAIIALAANAAMETQRRIDFDPRWFQVPEDPTQDVNPDWDPRPEQV